MKDAKDFNVRQFVPEGLASETTVIGGGARQSEQSELTERNEATGQPEPTPLSGQAEEPRQTASLLANEQSVSGRQTAHAQFIEPPQPTPAPPSRVSSRQRRASLDEYRETFLPVPKITDRQPVFVSRDIRDKIDGVVRRLGERKMSVSGFLENLDRHHLDLYADDLEQWRRL